MPLNLQNSPYSGFDPEKDPYIQQYRDAEDAEYNPDENYGADFARNANIAARNILALTLGLPGDLQSFLHKDIERLREQGNAGLMSEEIAEKLGGDPNHPSWLPAALVAPGPGEFKTAMSMMKGLASEAAMHSPEVAALLFHGSPHKFEKFDLSKLGTGEGKQVYGYGLYFADSPDVAGRYVRSNKMPTIVAQAAMKKFGQDKTKAIEYLTTGGQGGYSPNVASAAGRMIKNGTYNKGGHKYEIDIPDEVLAKTIDWDAPLSQGQKNKIKDLIDPNDIDPETETALAKVVGLVPDDGDVVSGQELYSDLSNWIGSDQGASEFLLEADIHGIRSLDGEVGAKTRNTVLFDPNDIRSVKRDGETVYRAQTELDKTIELVDKY